MTPLRFFVTETDAVWDGVRATLDAAWGWPDDRTVTCAPPASALTHDEQGRPLIAAKVEWCEWPDVAALLPDLLSSGLATEITEEQHREMLGPGDGIRP